MRIMVFVNFFWVKCYVILDMPLPLLPRTYAVKHRLKKWSRLKDLMEFNQHKD